MRSGNPVLSNSTFTDVSQRGYSRPMTLTGVINRSVLLLVLVAGTATGVWAYSNTQPSAIYPTVMIGALGGFAVAMVTSFKRDWAPLTSPIYAVLEGLFIGGISLVMEQRFPGLVLQAVLLTFGVMFALLAAYQTRIIRPSETFKSVIVAATFGIVIVYLVSMVFPTVFSHGDPAHQRQRSAWHRFQSGGRRNCSSQPGAGLRLYRKWRCLWSSKVDGMVRCFRANRNAGLALHRDPSFAFQVAAKLDRARRGVNAGWKPVLLGVIISGLQLGHFKTSHSARKAQRT